MKHKIELLSPAGSEAALHAAVQSGADAVYFGGMKFGARHSAKNFSIEDIKKQTAYCRLYGVDVHVTVNTLIKERETAEVIEYVRALSDAGVDALIIQDIGAAELIHRAIPEMQLHASTQMTVTDLDGVRYLEDMGFSRVVLARELNMREIERICAHAKAEIEVFAHGAICMCYSGQCLMSSIIGGRSGNRGRCAQPCRLCYELLDKGRSCGSAYVLSPKDMALVRHLDELKEIGVSSLKIEGRLKRAEYVSAVTGIYRKYLDSGAEVSKEDMRELHDAFSRSGFTDGYFTGRLGRDMMSHKNPGNENNSFTRAAVMRAQPDANIRRIPVSISGSLHIGKPVTISVFDESGAFAEVKGDLAGEKAVNRPLGEERFCEQLKKTGSTPFVCDEVFADIDAEAIVPVKEINRVRREALDAFAAQKMQRPVRKTVDLELTYPLIKREIGDARFSADVRTAEQGREAAKRGIDLIYAPTEVCEQLRAEYPETELVAKTEDIFRAENYSAEALSVSSNAAIYHYRGKRLYGTHRLNVFNSRTLEHYRGLELVTLSPELRIEEIRDIASHTDAPFELIGYGRIPLMLMRNCPLKAMGHCQKGADRMSLRDRRGGEFPVICHKGCIAELLNSKPLFMADRLSDLVSTGAERIKLIFTTETPHMCGHIIDMYTGAAGASMRENTFTRGHYYRGVD